MTTSPDADDAMDDRRDGPDDEPEGTCVMATEKMTQAELLTRAKERFGENPLDFAFTCPSCGEVATIRDFIDAGDASMAGQGCIGRLLGALKGKGSPTTDGGRSIATRGCDWAAFGLISGPWTVVMPDGREVSSFPLAEVS
jgi:hypothetical protein